MCTFLDLTDLFRSPMGVVTAVVFLALTGSYLTLFVSCWLADHPGK